MQNKNNQKPNSKHQIITNTQQSISQAKSLVIGKLVIGAYLIIGVWSLEFKSL